MKKKKKKKEQNFDEIVIGWFSSKNVSGGSTPRSFFFCSCNFEVNLEFLPFFHQIYKRKINTFRLIFQKL